MARMVSGSHWRPALVATRQERRVVRIDLRSCGPWRTFVAMLKVAALLVWAALKKQAPVVVTNLISDLSNSGEKDDQLAREVVESVQKLREQLASFVALVQSGSVTMTKETLIAATMMHANADRELDGLIQSANRIAKKKFDVASVLREGERLALERMREILKIAEGDPEKPATIQDFIAVSGGDTGKQLTERTQ